MSTEPIAPNFDVFAASRSASSETPAPGVAREDDDSELLDLREMAARYRRRRVKAEDATPVEMIDAGAVLIASPREQRGPTWSLTAALAGLAFALGIVATLGALRFVSTGDESRAAADEPAAPAVAVADPAPAPRRAAAPADEPIVPDPAPAVAVAPEDEDAIDDDATEAVAAPAVDERAEAETPPARRPAAPAAPRAPAPPAEPRVAEVAPEPAPTAADEPPAPSRAPVDEPPAPAMSTAPEADGCTEVDCILDPGLDCCRLAAGTTAETGPPEHETEPAPDLRDSPTASELQAAMAPLKNGVWTCADRHDIDGVVNVRLSVAPDGSITPTVTRGPDAFKQCVAKLIRRVRLEPSRNGLAGAYPFVIR